ncbi:unnamed protein product, partial [Symbiodinium necroappetens]
MTSWLLLSLFLVGAHRDSQHFAVQLDDEIEESPPAILASPENVSSVLASVNAAEPMRVHLLAGVYPNVTFTLPRGANLELQGEPGTKMEDLVVYGDDDTTTRWKTKLTELTLKSLQVMRVALQESLPLYSLALIDLAVKALHHPGGDQAEEEANSTTLHSQFETYLFYYHRDFIPSLTIQRSFLMPMRMGLWGGNVTVLNSTIMLNDGIIDFRKNKGEFRLVSEDVLVVATSTLADVDLWVHGNASIVESNMTGKYELLFEGNHSHIENSHFGACYGSCVRICSRQSALVGSSMQTAVSVMCVLGLHLNLEIRDMEIFDIYTPFLQYVDIYEGRTTLDVTFTMVKLRNVWSAVKIEASQWKLTMQNITMEDVTNSGLTLQSRDESDRGIAQLRDISMHRIMGVGLVLDWTIANITDVTCRECNMAIAARGSSLNMHGVDILGKHKQCNGIALKSSRLEAHDVRMTNLAAGLLLKSSTVHLEDVFITDNVSPEVGSGYVLLRQTSALGVLPVNTTGTISGLVYFNDAADELCEDHNGDKVCPTLEHRSAAMKVHHSKALMLSLLACLVATISAVQGLKLLYTEKASAVALSLRMFLWMLGCGLWPVVMIGAMNVLLVIRRAVQEQEAKQRPHLEEFVGPEKKMMWRLLFLLIWSAGGILYVFFDVFLNRYLVKLEHLDGLGHGLMLTGDTRRRKELDEKKAQLKKRLDNQIPSQDGEAVQPPLEEHYCDTEETETKPEAGGKIKKSPVDALWMYASWLRADFKGKGKTKTTGVIFILAVVLMPQTRGNMKKQRRQLSQLVADLNSISAKEVREFDEKLTRRFTGCSTKMVLKLAERAQAKINTDYQQDFEAGKKKELPLARYVCDFLRATIYAADPFALALAFHEFQKRFKIVRVKNKFANEKLKTEERTNILVNFWVETEDMKQIGEVQFLMQEIYVYNLLLGGSSLSSALTTPGALPQTLTRDFVLDRIVQRRIAASPENFSSMLASIAAEPMRVKLPAGVYGNIARANLELWGEADAEVRLLEQLYPLHLLRDDMRSHIGPFDRNMDFDIRSLSYLKTLKVTGNFSIVNSTMTGNHVLCFHGDHCHKRMESSVVGPCRGYCIEVYNLTNSSVKLHGSSMQTATRLYQRAAENMEARELEAMTSWLLLGLFLVGAHRDSQHFAVQLDDEIEESPPAIPASPENVSSVLASVNAAVYPNVTLTLPHGANLELRGEPGTKMEDLLVRGDSEDDAETSRTELTLKSLQVMRAEFRESLPLDSLALIDVAVEALHDPGGDQTEEEANSRKHSRFETYLDYRGGSCIPSVKIQRSVLMPTRMVLCGLNSTVLNSTIMLTGGIPHSASGHIDHSARHDHIHAVYLSISRSHLGTTKKADFRLVAGDVLAVATSTLANVTLEVTGNASIVDSNMTGKYKLELYGDHSHVENSHFGACYGSCVSIRSRQSALVGSSMQTALSVLDKFGLHLEIRDMEIFDVYTPFLEYFGKDEGLLDVTFTMVKFRNVWSAVKIDASRWKLTMQGVTMEDVTNSGLTLQSRNASNRGIAQFRDVSMHNIMGVGLVLDRTIGNITGMTCRECNMAIAAHASSLNLRGVDILGKHKQCNGIALKSTCLEANDVRMTNLAAGLLLKSSTVHLEDVFITDNALGVLPVNTTGTISGLVYFNDAADELCEDHNGIRVCPTLEHRSAAMEVHHWKALMLSLLACLVATISAVQGLKLLYTEKALSLRMFLWMLGCGLWPVVMIGAVNVLLVIRRAVQEQEAKQRPHLEEFVGPEKKMMWRLLFLLIWSAGGILYVFFDVFLSRHGLMLTGDARRRRELDEKKAQLKKRLDNQSLRSRMQSLHYKLFAALDRRKVDATEIFQEMKDLAEEEASNLAGWFEDQRQVYQDTEQKCDRDDGGARMEKLEKRPDTVLDIAFVKIPSQDGEAVQPPLEEHYCDTEETETKPEA